MSYVETDPFWLARSAAIASLRPLSTSISTLKFKVLGDGDRPVEKAAITVYGPGFPSQGQTDANGEATLQVFGGGADTAQAVYVKPYANHWERFITRPQLDETGLNLIKLAPLSAQLPGFPNMDATGWGMRTMRLDLFPNLTGRGVKIAIVDSGCDKTHPQLKHVSNGLDLTGGDSGTGWTEDSVAHGTHCAGIIAGRRLQGGFGIRGFAPEAEIHALKVFPGGRFDSLLDALDECISRKIDIVNLSLGSDQVSEFVSRKIIEARQNGVACIVAAGNSSGPVQFPGVAPGVLTVSALGKAQEFPDDTNHAQTALPPPVQSGMFGAKFSCFGPQVSVSGPGVAIISTVPGGGYAAWDGTSMAAPHITGLAALLLAHHPDLESARNRRDSQRVDLLFQLIQSGSVPEIADPLHGGRGLPMLDRLFSANASARVPAGQVQNANGNGQSGLPLQQNGQFAGQASAFPQATLPDIIAAARLGHPGALQTIWQLRSAGYPI